MNSIRNRRSCNQWALKAYNSLYTTYAFASINITSPDFQKPVSCIFVILRKKTLKLVTMAYMSVCHNGRTRS